MAQGGTTITEWGGTELSRRIHATDVSCVEVMQAYLARIDAINPRHNAIVSRVPTEDLLAQAAAHDALLARNSSLGWLHGFPMAMKDTMPTRGVRSTFGSPLFADNIPEQDDFAAERMRAAGAILIGKTNIPEFGLGSHSYNQVFGVTGNAYAPDRTAGGSSGGAAVCLAQRMMAVADGSDMMGSLRNPAAFNNVFGYRPTQGLVPHGLGGEQFVTQLATEGPMARSVADLVQLLAIMAGRDDRAPLSIKGQWDGASAPPGRDVKTLRIAWLGDLNSHLATEPGVLALCEQALARLASDGATITPEALPFSPDEAWECWLTLRRWFVSGRLLGFRANPAQWAQLKPEAQWEAEQGASLTGAQVLAASAARTRLYIALLKLLDSYDAIALPSAQVFPFDKTLTWPKDIAGRRMDTYHRWMETTIYATLAGLPAISVPAGFNHQGLPMGLQLIGKPQGDTELLQLAHGYEHRAQDVLNRRPE